jgi:hypothetical protein
VPGSVCATVRNADPESVWQSLQWQMMTFDGFTSASYRISPQWHPPWTFIPSSIDFAVTATAARIGDFIVPRNGDNGAKWNNISEM